MAAVGKPGVGQPKGLGKVTSIAAVASKTLRGDIVDLLLQEARDVKDDKPWTQRGEKAQQIMIDRVERFADDFLDRVVAAVAAAKKDVLVVNAMGGQLQENHIVLKLKIERNAENAILVDKAMSLSDICLVLESPALYQDRRAQIHAAPDQIALDLPVSRSAVEDDEEIDDGPEDDAPPPKSTRIAPAPSRPPAPSKAAKKAPARR